MEGSIMKRRLAKIFSMALCMLMLASAMTGCGKSGDTEGQAKDENELQGFNATGFPISKDLITINVMCSKDATQGDWNDMILFKEMEKLTNVHMQFNCVDSTTWEEKKNLSFASEDLPDMYYSGITIKDEAMYGVEGKSIVPLDSYIDKYAPNLKKIFSQYSMVKPDITAIDGKIYTLPYVVDTLTIADATVYIRLDWLKEVGLEKPKTVDEFYSMLKAFKDSAPDRIPLSPHNYDMMKSYLLASFGELGGDPFYDKNSKNQVVFVPTTDQYKQYLIFANKLFKDKLLDNEVFTQKTEQVNAKAKENKIGALTMGTILTADNFKSGKVEVGLLQPLTSQYNSKPHIRGYNFVNLGYAAITKKNKYPEATMRWLDINYSDEDVAPGIGSLSLWMGLRGQQWDYTNAEKTKYTRMKPADSKLSEVEYTTKYVTPGWGPCKLVTKAIPENNPGQEMKATESVKNWFPYTEEKFPDVYLRYNSDEQTKLNSLQTDIENYVKQMESKFITGQESLDGWDKYVETLKKMNVDELIKIKQTAYDRMKK